MGFKYWLRSQVSQYIYQLGLASDRIFLLSRPPKFSRSTYPLYLPILLFFFFPSKKAEEGLVGPRCMCLACGTKQNTPSTHDFLKQGCCSEVVIETTAFITQRAVKPGWGSLFRDGGRKDANLRDLPLLLRQQALLGTKGTQHLGGWAPFPMHCECFGLSEDIPRHNARSSEQAKRGRSRAAFLQEIFLRRNQHKIIQWETVIVICVVRSVFPGKGEHKACTNRAWSKQTLQGCVLKAAFLAAPLCLIVVSSVDLIAWMTTHHSTVCSQSR